METAISPDTCLMFGAGKRLPCDVHTHVYTCVGAEWYALFACFAEQMVCTDEEVAALGVDVEHPSHARSEAVDSETHASVEP